MVQKSLGTFVYFPLMKKILLTTIVSMLFFSACVYEPEQFIADSSESGSAKSEIGDLYKLNGFLQVCNPSVTQDTVNYPASMLWLNFGGKLTVNTDDSAYNTTKVIQHDRLTVTDTSNTVLWYVKADSALGDCQFQDPEWSTHGAFVVTLRAYMVNEKCGRDLDYGIVAIRMSDKKRFTFYSDSISEQATPHLWVDPSAKIDTTADASTIEGFFGTNNVRLTYVDEKEGIKFVDFSGVKSEKDLKKALANPKKMKMPADIGSGYIESPLLSPDGNFVVYNVVEKTKTGWNSYVQQVSENSSPVLMEKQSGMMSMPAQPHWFAYEGRTFVLWAEFPSGEMMTGQQDDLSEVSMHDGSGGRTAMREVSLMADAPADLAVEWIGDTREVAPVPMIGGRSSDGRFLATGDSKAFLLKLP